MDLLTSTRRAIAYNSWANAHAHGDLARGSDVPDDAMRLAGHVAGAERLWLGRLVASSTPPNVWPDLTVEQFGTQLRELHHAWRGYGQSLSPERLADVVSFENQRGDGHEVSTHDILAHVLNHSTYHRGQIARILKQSGRDVTSTDLLNFRLENPE